MIKRRKSRKRLMNYGTGDLFNFHGAFRELKDALAKEKSVPGAFIRDVYYRGGPRYGVLTKNPRTRKKNVEWGTYEKGVFHPWTRRPKTRRKKAIRRRKNISPVLALEGLSNLKSLGFFDKKRRKTKRRNADDTKLVTQALHKLFPGKTAQQLTMAQLSQVIRAAQDLKAGKPITRRGNPSRRNYADATDLYTQFHGRGPRRVTDTKQPLSSLEHKMLPVAEYGTHPELSQLGKLVSIRFGDHAKNQWGKELKWTSSDDAPDLAAERKGEQLFLVGGNQTVDVAAIPWKPTKFRGAMLCLGFAYRVEYFTQKKFDNYQPVTYYHELGEETGKRPKLVYDPRKRRLHFVYGEYVVKSEGIVN